MYAKFNNDTDSISQTSSNKSAMRNVYNVKDLINTIKEIDIVYQNEITDEHIRISKCLKILTKYLLLQYKSILYIYILENDK